MIFFCKCTSSRYLLNFLKPRFKCGSSMAKSKYEYVKNFEEDSRCLMNCWTVVRLDGKGFHKFSQIHQFKRPNESRALKLMSKAASCVMEEFKEIMISFGHSDEFSFVFRKNSSIYNRRKEKILSLVNSIFSSSYVFYWKDYLPDICMKYPPSFDGRIVLYPTDDNLRDYMSWRQADVHINNLYNTCFWALVQNKQLSPQQAEEALRGTVSSEKNELLFQEFGINYNNEDAMFRKGTTLIRKIVRHCGQQRSVVIPLYTDIIKNTFWDENPELLSMKKTPIYENQTENLEYFVKLKI